MTTIDRITAQEASITGAVERDVLLEQSPDHYPEFSAALLRELEPTGAGLFFRSYAGSIYRLGPAQAPRNGLGIFLRVPPGGAVPPKEAVDEDVWSILRYIIGCAGGEWSVEALLQTRKLTIMPRSVYKLFPFVGQFIKIQQHYLHYVDVGAAEHAPTVVLLHGNPTWSFLYRDIIRKISKTCRAVAPDYVGFGLSDKPPEESWYTLENHTRTITEFIERLKLRKIILVVQDWGGPIGLGYALEHLENVAGMLIMNTWAWPQPSPYHASVFPWKMWHAPFVGAHCFERLNVLVERGLFHATGSFEKMKEGPVLEGYQLPFPTPHSRIGMLAFPRNIPLKAGDLNWDRMERLREGLAKLPFPCRILWGERDVVFPPENAYRFQELISNCSQPRMIPGGKHFVQEDAPGEIAEEILTLARPA